jgi:hypothetical protein
MGSRSRTDPCFSDIPGSLVRWLNPILSPNSSCFTECPRQTLYLTSGVQVGLCGPDWITGRKAWVGVWTGRKQGVGGLDLRPAPRLSVRRGLVHLLAVASGLPAP